MGHMILEALEFESAYAARSGITVELLRKRRTVRRCVCGDESCEGWASVPLDIVEDERDFPGLGGLVPGSVIGGRP